MLSLGFRYCFTLRAAVPAVHHIQPLLLVSTYPCIYPCLGPIMSVHVTWSQLYALSTDHAAVPDIESLSLCATCCCAPHAVSAAALR